MTDKNHLPASNQSSSSSQPARIVVPPSPHAQAGTGSAGGHASTQPMTVSTQGYAHTPAGAAQVQQQQQQQQQQQPQQQQQQQRSTMTVVTRPVMMAQQPRMATPQHQQQQTSSMMQPRGGAGVSTYYRPRAPMQQSGGYPVTYSADGRIYQQVGQPSYASTRPATQSPHQPQDTFTISQEWVSSVSLFLVIIDHHSRA